MKRVYAFGLVACCHARAAQVSEAEKYELHKSMSLVIVCPCADPFCRKQIKITDVCASSARMQPKQEKV